MLRAVLLRRVGAVAALLGTGCLLIALVLPWVLFEPNRTVHMTGVVPEDYSLLRLLVTPGYLGFHPAVAIFILHLLPVLGSCLVAIEGLQAWQGRAATRAGSTRLLLGMGCALFGLAAIHEIVYNMPVGMKIEGPPMLRSAGPGASLASLGFVAIVVGGVLLAVGAFLHRWTLKRNNSRASATTTG